MVVGGHRFAVGVLRPRRVEGPQVLLAPADQDAAVLQLLGHRVGGQVERGAVPGRGVRAPERDQRAHAVPVGLDGEVEVVVGVRVHHGAVGTGRGGGAGGAGQTEPDDVVTEGGLHRAGRGGGHDDAGGVRAPGTSARVAPSPGVVPATRSAVPVTRSTVSTACATRSVDGVRVSAWASAVVIGTDPAVHPATGIRAIVR
ncbi:hypothetical protein AB0J25_09540 [Streptomyces sp. NPDC049910]|uniref:hypothetical protein n=1 Tax=Streptomyces sp. NPDC049910 TaxID=3155278 RepID=UPI00342B6A8B